MFRHQEQVREFHKKFKKEINNKPIIPSQEELVFRCKLILEEALEFCEAAGMHVLAEVPRSGEPIEVWIAPYINNIYEPDLVKMADALGDLQYVTDGAALACGIDLEPIGDEVHRSNMTKLWTSEEVDNIPQEIKDQNITATPVVNGTKFTDSLSKNERVWLVKREDGKVIKSPSYEPAQIEKILEQQKQISAESVAGAQAQFCKCPVISSRQVEDNECVMCGLPLAAQSAAEKSE